MTAPERLSFPRETTELLELDVRAGGVPVDSFEVAVLSYQDRPVTGWAPAAVLADRRGVMITGFEAGTYRIWVRYVGTWTHVIDAALVVIT